MCRPTIKHHTCFNVFTNVAFWMCFQMLQRENYILSEYTRLTGRHLEPLMKRCTQDRWQWLLPANFTVALGVSWCLSFTELQPGELLFYSLSCPHSQTNGSTPDAVFSTVTICDCCFEGLESPSSRHSSLIVDTFYKHWMWALSTEF